MAHDRGRARGTAARGRFGRSNTGRAPFDVCAFEGNAPLVNELRKLDDECQRTGKKNMRHGVLRALRSVQKYPLPITTEAEALALEGVGSFTARRMLRCLRPNHDANDYGSCSQSTSRSMPTPHESSACPKPSQQRNRENVNPRTAQGQCGSIQQDESMWQPTDDLPTRYEALCPHNGTRNTTFRQPPFCLGANTNRNAAQQKENLASPNAVIDARRQRPRPRRAILADRSGSNSSTTASAFFDGHWEAMLLVDNREHQSLSMQSTMLQKGIPCETRQLPLGDMLWVARRRDETAPEVLLGYIVERKTVFDLASSIIDGRYNEQKRRLHLSGVRRRMYLVEGSLSHQNQLPPATLRTALASSQVNDGLAVIRTASLRDTLDFLARTHRCITSKLLEACTARGEGVFDPALESTTPVNESESAETLKPGLTFEEYCSRCNKRAPSITMSHVLGGMVRQTAGGSAARAEAIVRTFGSPLGLMVALERAGYVGCDADDMVPGEEHKIKRGEEFLEDLRYGGGAGTNKLPLPLRHKLARLFAGNTIQISITSDRTRTEIEKSVGSSNTDWDGQSTDRVDGVSLCC